MNQSAQQAHPEQGKHLWEEADIGSGEKTPGQKETEDMIRQIPPLPTPLPDERQAERDAPSDRRRAEGSAEVGRPASSARVKP
ncbi:MAG: hypothetical protein V4754_05390 [Pseudomonadota bacterium]